jgi:hypothetical protein
MRRIRTTTSGIMALVAAVGVASSSALAPSAVSAWLMAGLVGYMAYLMTRDPGPR